MTTLTLWISLTSAQKACGRSAVEQAGLFWPGRFELEAGVQITCERRNNALLSLMDLAKSWETECQAYEQGMEAMKAEKKKGDGGIRLVTRLFEAQKRTLKGARLIMRPFEHLLREVPEWRIPPVDPDEDEDVTKCRYLNLTETADDEGNTLTTGAASEGLTEGGKGVIRYLYRVEHAMEEGMELRQPRRRLMSASYFKMVPWTRFRPCH